MEGNKRKTPGTRAVRSFTERLCRTAGEEILARGRAEVDEEDLKIVDVVHLRGYLAYCPRIVAAVSEWMSMRRADGKLACPWAGCEFHTYLGVNSSGSLYVAYPDLTAGEIPQPCLLDLCDHEPDGIDGQAIARLMNKTRQNISMLEQQALRKLRSSIWVSRLLVGHLSK